MDESVSIPEALLVLARFYAHESCGQCTPCRESTGWIHKMVHRIVDGHGRKDDLDTILDVARRGGGTTICAFYDGAIGPYISYVEKFREEAMVLPSGERLKVPHMGWSPVRQTRAHPLWAGIEDGARFYFAHSYYPVPAEAALTAATAAYPAPFTCAIARANIFAVQFHPEKSQRAGLRLLANFVGWDGSS